MSVDEFQPVIRADVTMRAQSAFYALRQIIWLLTPDGAVETFNPFWAEYTGLPRVIEGLAWSEVFHPEDRQRLVNARTLGIASRAPYEVEARLRRTDGAYRRHLCRVVPLWSTDELTGWLGTAIDVEEVRAAEDAARDNERRKHKILEAISDGYYRLDRAFRFVEVNPAFERMTGKTRAEVIGENLWAAFPSAPDIGTYLTIPFLGARTSERYAHSINRWAEVTIYRSEDGFEAYFRDISDRKRFEVWQRALTRIAAELRLRTDRLDMTTLAAEVIGETLGLIRAGYVYVTPGTDDAIIERDWVSSPAQRRSPGHYQVSDWGTYLLPLTTGEVVAITDVETDPRSSAAATGWRQWNVRAAAFVPLVAHDQLYGYLMLHDDKPRAWTDDEMAFVRTVSDLVWASMSRQG